MGRNNNKNKTPVVEPTKARPPGQVLTGGHGPQKPVAVADGPSKLRGLLHLSPNCEINHVCEDAVAEIQRLRTSKLNR